MQREAAMLNHEQAKSRVSRPILDALMLALANGHGRQGGSAGLRGVGP